jgi:archaetidylinositol phosphate synthase
MLDTYVRPALQQWFVDPVARGLTRWSWMKPNYVTLFSGALGVLAAIGIYAGWAWLAVGSLWLSGYFDVLDGTVARLTQQSSAQGAVLDILMDRLVEFSCVLALFAVDPIHRGFWAILMLGSILLCITSFLVVGVFTENETEKGFYYSPGLMERAEAFVFFSFMIVFPGLFTPLAILFTLLVAWTAWRRTSQFMRQAARKTNN